MPELPEVETIRQDLLQLLPGKRVISVPVLRRDILAGSKPQEFRRRILGRCIRDCLRRGKHLILQGEDYTLLIHLGMSGRLLYFPRGADPDRHTHLRLGFADGSELHYHDPRRFGRIRIYPCGAPSEIPELRSLGWDPLEDPISLSAWRMRLSRRRGPIKQVLMDQRCIAGIGNIYASEILFSSSIDPLRPACTLTPRETRGLARAIQEVLRKAVRNRGTSISTFRDAGGREGSHQDHLCVYGRAEEGCIRCHTPIIKRILAGRSTYSCPRCQK